MWMDDLKEGPGRFVSVSRHEVYEGEWMKDLPRCGTLISDTKLLPEVIFEKI
jgi:hypothetical protein